MEDVSNTNNVAQIGLIAKAPLAKNLDFYAKGAVGTKKTTMWEAGLGYSITPDLDINAGYRYLTTLMIFCNPHNPIGYVWTKEEVERIAALCHKHHVVLVSDEIHADLVREGRDMTPAFVVTGPARSSVISLSGHDRSLNNKVSDSRRQICGIDHRHKISRL